MFKFFTSSRDRFKIGINLASQSFLFVRHNPILLIYSFAGITTSILLQIILLGENSVQTCLRTIGGTACFFKAENWYSYIIQLFLTFTCVYILTLTALLILFHAHRILNGKKVDIAQNIQRLRYKTKISLYWASIVTIITYASNIAGSLNFRLAMLISIATMLAWSFVTFAVLPVIARERKNLTDTASKSKAIVLYSTFEIIGGCSWITLVSIFCIAPLIILTYLFSGLHYAHIFTGIATLLAILIMMVISTTYVVFRLMIYRYYITPLEELQALSYMEI